MNETEKQLEEKENLIIELQCHNCWHGPNGYKTCRIYPARSKCESNEYGGRRSFFEYHIEGSGVNAHLIRNKFDELTTHFLNEMNYNG